MIEEAVEELREDAADTVEPGEQAQDDLPVLDPEQVERAWSHDRAVLCLASRSPLDEAACLLLAKLLEKRGVSTRVQPFADVVSAKSFKIDTLYAPLVCPSCFGALGSPAHVRYLIRRLRRVMPKARFLAGFWMLAEQASKAEEWRTAVGADPRLRKPWQSVSRKRKATKLCQRRHQGRLLPGKGYRGRWPERCGILWGIIGLSGYQGRARPLSFGRAVAKNL